MEVFLHNLFLKYATETEGNKCKAAFYTYKQIDMRSLEPFWPCTILAKNLGDVLARGLSIAKAIHSIASYCFDCQIIVSRFQFLRCEEVFLLGQMVFTEITIIRNKQLS